MAYSGTFLAVARPRGYGIADFVEFFTSIQQF